MQNIVKTEGCWLTPFAGSNIFLITCIMADPLEQTCWGAN